jgi:hypothetical protein
MMVAEDVIITEEVLVVEVWEEVSRREGSFAPRREGSGGGFRSEVQLQEKVVLTKKLISSKKRRWFRQTKNRRFI